MATAEDIIKLSRVIAVVGLSPNPERPSYRVTQYLMRHGFRVVPVNPNIKEVLGLEAYPDLKSIPFPVDTVDVFRRSEEVLPIVQDAIAIKAKAVWLQEGVTSDEAEEQAKKAGLLFVMDT